MGCAPGRRGEEGEGRGGTGAGPLQVGRGPGVGGACGAPHAALSPPLRAAAPPNTAIQTYGSPLSHLVPPAPRMTCCAWGKRARTTLSSGPTASPPRSAAAFSHPPHPHPLQAPLHPRRPGPGGGERPDYARGVPGRQAGDQGEGGWGTTGVPAHTLHSRPVSSCFPPPQPCTGRPAALSLLPPLHFPSFLLLKPTTGRRAPQHALRPCCPSPAPFSVFLLSPCLPLATRTNCQRPRGTWCHWCQAPDRKGGSQGVYAKHKAYSRDLT